MNEISKLFLQFFLEDPWSIVINIVFLLVIPIQDVLLPHLYGKVISAIEKKDALLKPFIIVIIVLILIQLGYLLSDWYDNKLFPKLQAYIRNNMLLTVFKNYETKHEELLLGDIMSKFIKIPTHLTQWFERCKNYILPYIIAYIFSVIYFMYYDKILGVGLAILIFIYAYLVLGAPSFFKNISVIKDNIQNDLHEEIDDTLGNLISIYGSDQQNHEIERLYTYEKNYIEAYQNTINGVLKIRAYVTPIIICFLLLFCYRCSTRLRKKEISADKFIPLFLILLYILDSMMMLTDQVRDMIFEIGIINNFEDMFSFIVPNKINNNILQNKFNIPQGIVMHNVYFTYNSDVDPILNNFNLIIKPGERIAIVGEIGSGKSTVLKILLKLQEITSGEIYLNRLAYSNISVRDIRKRIGYIPQQPTLFNRTIFENIKYGNKNLTDNDIIKLFIKLGIENEFMHLKNGLNTKIGKNGSKISGGQRQLIWSLRILLHDPEILILDEPTASLDNKTKKTMIRLYDYFMSNKTIIMVTHDDVLMNYANRIITMNKGQIINDRKISN